MKTAAMLIIAVLATSFACAQCATVAVESNLEGNLQFDVYAREDNNWLYACKSGDWSEAYVGYAYAPADWCEIALGAGFESDQSSLRFGGSIWAGKGDFSLLHLFEDGGSGPWHKTTLVYKISDSFKAGLIDRAFYGRGITAEYNLGHGTKLGGAWYEGGRATVSLSHSF